MKLLFCDVTNVTSNNICDKLYQLDAQRQKLSNKKKTQDL